MENAVDALKIAVAVFVFLVALGVAFGSISKIKNTTDVVFHYTDRTNFYDNIKLNTDEISNGGRKVNVDTIISNLYRLKKESLAIEVDDVSFDTADEDLESKINTFKNNNLDYEGDYIETFSEVIISGIYKTAEDGTMLTITPGGKKIYIKYEKI